MRLRLRKRATRIVDLSGYSIAFILTRSQDMVPRQTNRAAYDAHGL
jgi:hypothetical protein